MAMRAGQRLEPEATSLTARFINKASHARQPLLPTITIKSHRKQREKFMSVVELIQVAKAPSAETVSANYQKNRSMNKEEMRHEQDSLLLLNETEERNERVTHRESSNKSLAELMDKRREEQCKIRRALQNRRACCLSKIHD